MNFKNYLNTSFNVTDAKSTLKPSKINIKDKLSVLFHQQKLKSIFSSNVRSLSTEKKILKTTYNSSKKGMNTSLYTAPRDSVSFSHQKEASMKNTKLRNELNQWKTIALDFCWLNAEVLVEFHKSANDSTKHLSSTFTNLLIESQKLTKSIQSLIIEKEIPLVSNAIINLNNLLKESQSQIQRLNTKQVITQRKGTNEIFSVFEPSNKKSTYTQTLSNSELSNIKKKELDEKTLKSKNPTPFHETSINFLIIQAKTIENLLNK